jgi:dolichol-phosphate mannosyltransferase
LQLALSRSDRPKRDSAIVMHADFSHGPEYLPEFVRRLDSGADIVVGEALLKGDLSRAHRIVRRWAPILLRRAVRVVGVSDTVSGFAAYRLMTLRGVLPGEGRDNLSADGWSANAELLARAARSARRIETLDIVERHDRRSRATRVRPWQALREVWRAGRQIRLPSSDKLSGRVAS